MANLLPFNSATPEQVSTIILDLHSAIEDVLKQHGAYLAEWNHAVEVADDRLSSGIVHFDFVVTDKPKEVDRAGG